MGTGVVGPIGRDRLPHFALSRAVLLPGHWQRNAQAATCKLCGTRLPKGRSQLVAIAGDVIGYAASAYACEGCFRHVCAANEVFPTRAWLALREGWWMGDPPAWWRPPQAP